MSAQASGATLDLGRVYPTMAPSDNHVIRAIARDQARKLFPDGRPITPPIYWPLPRPGPKLVEARLRVGLVQLFGALQVMVTCHAVDLFFSVLFQDLDLDFGRPRFLLIRENLPVDQL